MAYDSRTDDYDFDNMDDVARFIKELVKPCLDEVVAERGSATIMCCGMETLTALHRLMENRVYDLGPIAPIPDPLKDGWLILEWNGAEDNSWAIF